MSSMRNAVQRRVHRERGQPEERKKWGLLEKHKDYSARARDYNAKKAKLKVLRERVAEKNPDEFYFGMLSRTGPKSGAGQDGKITGPRGNQVLSQDAVRLLKTQDLAYIRTARNKAMKEVSQLERAAIGIVGQGQKIVYVTDEADDRGEEGKRAEDIETLGEGCSGKVNGGVPRPDERLRRKLRHREAEKLKMKLSIARKRSKVLAETEQALELQRDKMAKTTTVGGINKNGVKFKVRDRKR